MKASHAIILTLSGATLLFVVYKGFKANMLMGSSTSGDPAAQVIQQPLSDSSKLAMVADLSTTQAKIDGAIASNEPKQQLQQNAQNILTQLKR